MIPVAATGIGSMPGTSVAEAVAVVAGELPDWPFLPELPARGAGADMVGRTAVLLLSASPEFALEPVPTGWRRSGRIGPDMRRARSWLGEDLDRLEQVLGSSGGALKIQMCGPWTWAAEVEDGAGRRLIRDPSFMSDLADAMASAAASHVGDVRKRLPGRQVVLELDEPGLPAALAGAIPTASGFGRLDAVSEPRAAQLLKRTVAGLDVPVLMHSCAAFPFGVARSAGISGVSWDATGAPDEDLGDAVAETFEAGISLVVGVVRSVGADDLEQAWQRFTRLWARTGLGPEAARKAAVSPACGLAGNDPRVAREALATGRRLQERILSVEP